MGNLRSALEQEANLDLSGLSGPELAERVRELDHARRRLDHVWFTTLAAFHRSGEWELDGASSAGAWVAAATLQDHSRSSAQVRMGKRLARMPVVAVALAEGEISSEHVRVLTDAVDVPEIGDAEQVLVEHARTLRPAETRRVVEHWRAVVGRERGSADHDRRRLHLSSLLDGMRALDGLLDREGGAIVERALDDLMTKSADCAGEPSRTRSQRWVDALVDLCDRYLRGAMGSGNRRPQISVVADVETLSGRSGRPTRMGDGEQLTAEAARRIACDAGVSRILTDPAGVPLDVGRSARTVPPAMKRALDVRDGGCSFPGCDRPPDWCDAHHVRHWLDGGATCLTNLALVCRRHHTLLHERRVRLVLGTDGKPWWLRADGTDLSTAARPPPRPVPVG